MKNVDEIIWKTLIFSGFISVLGIITIILYYFGCCVPVVVENVSIDFLTNIFACSGFVFTACLIWFNSIFVPDARWYITLGTLPFVDNYTIKDYMINYENIKYHFMKNYEYDRYDIMLQFFKYIRSNDRMEKLQPFHIFNNRKKLYLNFGNDVHKEFTKKSPIFEHINSWLINNKLNYWCWDHLYADYDIKHFNLVILKLYEMLKMNQDNVNKIFYKNGGFLMILENICQDINEKFVVDGKKDEHFNKYLYECLTESMTKESNS